MDSNCEIANDYDSFEVSVDITLVPIHLLLSLLVREIQKGRKNGGTEPLLFSDKLIV